MNVSCFRSFVDVSFEPLDMCASFGIVIEIRKFMRGNSAGFQGRKIIIYWYKGLKGSYGTWRDEFL